MTGSYLSLALALSVSLASSLATAKEGGNVGNGIEGGNVGNGGEGVVCKQSDGTETVRLFDFVEVEREEFPRVIDASGNRDRILSRWLRAVKRRDDYTGDILVSTQNEMKVTWVKSGFNVASGDRGNTTYVLPPNCKFVQLALQTKESSWFGLHRYGHVRINLPYYLRLSPLDQAGLFLHEEIVHSLQTDMGTMLRQFLGLEGPYVTDRVREATRILSSEFVTEAPKNRYIDMVYAIGFFIPGQVSARATAPYGPQPKY